MAAPLAPFAPLAWTALRVGAVVATAYYVGRRTRSAPKHVWRERAMDDATEGLEVTTDRSDREGNAHASVRLKRTLRMRTGGPGLEIDITTLGRLRLRRVD